MCKQEQEYSLLFQYPPNFIFYYSTIYLGEILAPKPSRAKEWLKDGQEREREW
jgi:hypothetical protein